MEEKESLGDISDQLRNDNIFLLEQVKQLQLETEALKKERETWSQLQDGSAAGFLNSLSTQISKHVQIPQPKPIPSDSNGSLLEAKVQELEKELLEVHEEKTILETKLREIGDVQLKGLSTENEALQKQNELLQKKMQGMKEELEHIAEGKLRNEALEKENENLKSQILSMQESVEGLEAAMEESRDRYVHMKEVAETQSETSDSELKLLQQEIKEKSTQLTQSLQNNERIERDLRLCEEKVHRIQQAHLEEIQQLKAENASTSLDLFQVRSELVNNLSNRTLKEKNLQQLSEDKASLETRFEAAIDLLAELQSDLEKKEQTIAALKSDLEKKEIELGIALEMILSLGEKV